METILENSDNKSDQLTQKTNNVLLRRILAGIIDKIFIVLIAILIVAIYNLDFLLYNVPGLLGNTVAFLGIEPRKYIFIPEALTSSIYIILYYLIVSNIYYLVFESFGLTIGKFITQTRIYNSNISVIAFRHSLTRQLCTSIFIGITWLFTYTLVSMR